MKTSSYTVVTSSLPNRMSIEKNKILELLGIANKLVLANQGQPLTTVQEEILKQALEGKKLQQIQITGYEQGTIQRQFAPKLWKLIGEDVSIKNVRLKLEKALEQPTIPGEGVSPPIIDPPPILLKRIPHNLPKQHCTKFIGRQEEANKLLKLLSPNHAAHLICIVGLGGVGKTSLITACARQCLHASCNVQSDASLPTFDTIIFVSAKQQYLTYSGIGNRRDRRQKDIIRQILEMLDSNNMLDENVAGTSFEGQIFSIYRALATRRTLLIIDNLETVENKQDINDFLYDLPPSVKAVVTTREGIDGIPIRLNAMPEQDGLNLVQHQAGEMGISLKPQDRQTLYQISGGLPIAIDFAIGQLAYGYSIQEIQARVSHSTGDVARFCFENAVQGLQRRPAYWLLLAMTFFPAPALREALVQVALPTVERSIAEDALVQLQTLSLITQDQSSEGEPSRYSMLPLTREYVLARLENHLDFEQEARDRWVSWYLSFSQQYSNIDTGRWHGRFDRLDEEWQNIQAVADWCMSVGQYDTVFQIWQNLKPYIYIVGRQLNRLRYWNKSLVWLDWLTQTASQRGDWSSVVKTMFDSAWILIATGKEALLEQADQLLEKAWELHDYQEPKDRVNSARYIAILKNKQCKFADAITWLNRSEEILQQAEFDECKRLEHLSHTRYYQGVVYFKTGEIESSKNCLEEARSYAKSSNLERLVQVIETSLADVAIRQGNLTEAERLLIEGLRIAEANKDSCRTAFIKQSFASLAKTRGNLMEAKRYATEARVIFENLGMMAETEYVQNVIENELQE